MNSGQLDSERLDCELLDNGGLDSGQLAPSNICLELKENVYWHGKTGVRRLITVNVFSRLL